MRTESLNNNENEKGNKDFVNEIRNNGNIPDENNPIISSGKKDFKCLYK